MTESKSENGRKSVIITGCTSGLGRSLFDRFSDAGWFVTGCGRRAHLLDSLRKEREADSNLVACDIRLENHVAALMGAVKLKPGYIDVLILNAGAIGQLPLPSFLQTNLMELRKLFETNVFANFNIVEQLAPLIRPHGLIVHITSDASRTPYPGWAGYGASKAAFNLAVDVFNAELYRSGLKAVNIDPGDMDTEMHRLAVPDADVSQLKQPQTAAAEIYEQVNELLTQRSG
jgi:NAD(P)-dependent dehydrogenase (short-subunit alcohol dehydrogenase family)